MRISSGLLLLVALSSPAAAYETDQFNNRLESVADSTSALNGRVNETINQIAGDWTGQRNDEKFVNKIYYEIGGVHWVDKLEKWAMKSDDVDRLPTPKYESIYSGHPIWATRFAALFGVGPTIKVNDVLIGSDKLGHFLSQGRKFWRRYQRYDDEARAAEHSAFTERAIFGQMTTGSYSNADLVANYEGHRFYRSLFEDDIVPGKKSILKWQDGQWHIQRAFDFADHVNDYWDEAIHLNHFDGLLYEHMKTRLMEFCPDYEKAPQRYSVRDEAELKERYAHLELRDTSELRLGVLCEQEAVAASGQ